MMPSATFNSRKFANNSSKFFEKWSDRRNTSKGSRITEFPIPRQQSQQPSHPWQSVFAMSLLSYNFPSETSERLISLSICIPLLQVVISHYSMHR